jgi:hypothetical protein
MTSSKKWLFKIVEENDEKVVHGDNKEYKVEGTCIMLIMMVDDQKNTMDNVLYALGLRLNLFSISQTKNENNILMVEHKEYKWSNM